jgi:hypothetical protein
MHMLGSRIVYLVVRAGSLILRALADAGFSKLMASQISWVYYFVAVHPD